MWSQKSVTYLVKLQKKLFLHDINYVNIKKLDINIIEPAEQLSLRNEKRLTLTKVLKLFCEVKKKRSELLIKLQKHILQHEY